MARINLDTLRQVAKEHGSVHKKVYSTYTVFQVDGEKYVQIDTYGSGNRVIPEKISQSIQFDRDSAKFLVKLLIDEFNLLS